LPPEDLVKLLIIEDEPGTIRILSTLLSEDGYTVDHAMTVEEGRALATRVPYDGILLDLHLGDRDGVSLLQDLRRHRIGIPVLILTSETSEETIVRALDAGADEYVMKPFRSAELSARVRALVRRRVRDTPSDELVSGSLLLNRLERRALVRGAALNLSPKEVALLEHLLQFTGTVVSRTAMLERVWGMRFDPGSNVVDVHVARLRRKLSAAGAPVRIESKRGTGFVLVPESVDPFAVAPAMRVGSRAPRLVSAE
jgi:DNA-binding response OmpR family regulator